MMELQFGFLPQTFLLVVFRVLAILVPIMIYARSVVRPRIMVAIAFVMSIALMPVIPESWVTASQMIVNIPSLIIAVINEIILAAALTLVIEVFIGIFEFGGYIASWGSSLMMAKELNPMSNAQSSIYSHIIQSLFIVVFFINGGHLVLLRMLSTSFIAVPTQMQWLNGNHVEYLVSLGSVMFRWGLKFGIPILAASLTINVSMGMIARMAPDFNVLFLSLPVRLFVGMTVFSMCVRYSGGFFDRVIDMMMKSCATFLM